MFKILLAIHILAAVIFMGNIITLLPVIILLLMVIKP